MSDLRPHIRLMWPCMLASLLLTLTLTVSARVLPPWRARPEGASLAPLLVVFSFGADRRHGHGPVLKKSKLYFLGVVWKGDWRHTSTHNTATSEAIFLPLPCTQIARGGNDFLELFREGRLGKLGLWGFEKKHFVGRFGRQFALILRGNYKEAIFVGRRVPRGVGWAIFPFRP